MNFGLKQEILNQITQVFKKYLNIKEVYIYGSRARGNFKKTSDIDLAVVFSNAESKIANLKWDLEELDIIYKIDVLDYQKIQNKDLKEQIDLCKKQIYSKI
ncbi:MAG: nucleotidyltransferase domain-containing protein [bacterium]|nr:nucleotidyltransferase domain-containing protein [bacterium]MBU1917524.1 nucleotidyltransferase domain-containing protein [bacterium]